MAIIQATEHRSRSPARRLSSRQLDTLFLICKGLRNAEIAAQLQVSERTIKGYVTQLLLIFDATNRTELAVIAFEANIFQGTVTVSHSPRRLESAGGL